MLLVGAYEKMIATLGELFFKDTIKRLPYPDWDFSCELEVHTGKVRGFSELACVGLTKYNVAIKLFNAMPYQEHFIFECYTHNNKKAAWRNNTKVAWKIQAKLPMELFAALKKDIILTDHNTKALVMSFAKQILVPFCISKRTSFYSDASIIIKNNHAKAVEVLSYGLAVDKKGYNFNWFAKHIALCVNKYGGVEKKNYKFLRKAKSFPVDGKFLRKVSLLISSIHQINQQLLANKNLFYELAHCALRDDDGLMYYHYLKMSAMVNKNQAGIISYLTCLYYGFGRWVAENQKLAIKEYKKLLAVNYVRPSTMLTIAEALPKLGEVTAGLLENNQRTPPRPSIYQQHAQYDNMLYDDFKHNDLQYDDDGLKDSAANANGYITDFSDNEDTNTERTEKTEHRHL